MVKTLFKSIESLLITHVYYATILRSFMTVFLLGTQLTCGFLTCMKK